MVLGGGFGCPVAPRNMIWLTAGSAAFEAAVTAVLDDAPLVSPSEPAAWASACA